MKSLYFKRIIFIALMGINLFSSGLLTADNFNTNTNSICQKSRKANQSSRNACKKSPLLRTEVEKGKNLALETCQENFRDRKWNCTTSHKSFRRIMKTDTREAAYLNAITAAGILYSVTSACSSGVLWQCHCDRTERDVDDDQMWQWGGCSDDIEYGYKKSQRFTKNKHISSDIKELVRNHNNEAGRLAITQNMKKVCKCHGLSGSCALQTCWRNMPMFPLVGQVLKDKYDGAPKVTGDNEGKNLIPEGETIKPPENTDLVYTDDSPDFCLSHKRFGTSGTVGRVCNQTSYGPDGCDIMCCNRGFETKTFTVRKKCNCKFVWCCQVICEMCVEDVTVSLCK